MTDTKKHQRIMGTPERELDMATPIFDQVVRDLGLNPADPPALTESEHETVETLAVILTDTGVE